MKYLNGKNNFLGITEDKYCAYKNSKIIIQPIPYEYTSSYLTGSEKGPAAIIKASQFVELYDEELDMETYEKAEGICTLKPLNFNNRKNQKAIDYIEKKTYALLKDNKFVISLGAEHTITLGLVKAHQKKYKNLSVLQIDAHSDLRQSYHNNPLSHASVMARVHDIGVPIVQVGIRAQCKEESVLIKNTSKITTFYAYQIRKDENWAKKALDALGEDVYITVDADGFDPSVVPAVGTAEPGGMLWYETLAFLKSVFKNKNVVGFDIVEIAPVKGNILSEYNMAKLCYKMLGYQVLYSKK